jgi:nucleoside-diphosphate-sugar epimerase
VTWELEGRTALVTGATGFIGGHLLTRLEQAGAEIHALSRRPPVGDARARWHEADLAEFEAVRRVVSAISPDVVFHLAGETHGARELDLVLPTFRSNLVSTVNLLTATAETSPAARVVLAGSLEEPETGDVAASSPYAASKLGARAYGRLFNKTMGLPVIVLRVFMAYGPGQRDLGKLVPYVILSLLRGEAPRLTSGRREIDWVYVGDVADAFIAAARTDNPAGASVDAGSGKAVSIRSLVESLVEMIAPRLEAEFGAIPDRPLEQIRVADVNAAELAIGWRPKVTLEEGLRRTVEWYREQLELDRL